MRRSVLLRRIIVLSASFAQTAPCRALEAVALATVKLR